MPTVATFGGNLAVFAINKGKFTEKASFSYKGDTAELRGGRVSWAGNSLVCAIESSGTIPILKYHEDRLEVVRRICDTNASSAAFLNWTNENLVVGSLNGNNSVWSLRNKRISIQFSSKDTNAVEFLSVNADDCYIASAEKSGVIQLYSLKSNHLISSMNFTTGEELTDLKFASCRRNLLAFCTMEGSIMVADIMSGVPTANFKNAHEGACSNIVISPTNSNIIISASLSQSLRVHDIREKKKVYELNMQRPLTCIDMLKSDPIVLMGTVDGYLMSLDLRTSNILSEVLAHSQRITSVKAASVDAIGKAKQFKECELFTPEEASPNEFSATFNEIVSPLTDIESSCPKRKKSLVKVEKPAINITSGTPTEPVSHSTPNVIDQNGGDLSSNSFWNQIQSPDVGLVHTPLGLGHSLFLNRSSSSNGYDKKIEAGDQLLQNQNQISPDILNEIINMMSNIQTELKDLKQSLVETREQQKLDRELFLDLMREVIFLKESNAYEHLLTRMTLLKDD